MVVFFLPLAAILFFGASGFAYSQTAASTTATSAKAKSVPQTYTRIFYYRDGPKALASLAKNYKSIDILAPQTYSLDGAGVLSGSVNPFMMSLAKVHDIKVMPLVTNKAFSQDHAHDFLDNPAAEDSAIQTLISEAKKFGFLGWQIDFEEIGRFISAKVFGVYQSPRKHF